MGPVLALLRASFAYMEGRIDPPSSLTRMGPEALAAEAGRAELWILPPPAAPLACVLLTPKADHLYLGKLAVTPTQRDAGLARQMIGLAEARAQALGLGEIRLEARVELTQNHATFARLGFTEIGQSAHPGFDRPTSLTFARPVPPRG
ncbi:GNAT family N-acetyltransferase [Pseudooceanicola sp. 200-1SW]